ncbi:MAG TPA: tetratricopeptide repeat protein [Chloroflexia bacterium]|nr:tetratricopeptide repeat protein [Chloroflexia bacterium]
MIDITALANVGGGPLKTGYDALERGAWDEARIHFQTALAANETPQALEGLGLALWWLNELDSIFDIRERAYLLYRARGDMRSAGRIALWLGWDFLGIRGQIAVANGWLQRAHSLLDGLEYCSEQGWLALREAENAILFEDDTSTTLKLAGRGVEIGRALGLIDLEMFGLALQGFALVSEGKVDEGMRCLDEATTAATGGEISNRTAIGSTCCCLIFACERVLDYDRALEWCERLQDYCERTGYVPLLGVCRSHYAGILIWAGAWEKAESELAQATLALQSTRPAFLAEAVVRMGFLRFQQGRLDEAVSLFEQVLYFPPAQVGMGRLALDLGEPETALDHAARYLRHVPLENRTERVAGLELMAKACLALGDFTQAQRSLDELIEIAGRIGSGPLVAIANLTAGLAAAAHNDHESARTLLEDAADMFGHSGAPYEMGQAQITLARSLEALGRVPAAERETRAALLVFTELGANRQVALAESLLRHLRQLLKIQPAQVLERPGLSPRQAEVLRLIAQGLNDQEIATQLVLSQHTVHRHVTNILSRLSVPSRSAAVAYAAREGLL